MKQRGTVGMGSAGNDEIFKSGVRDDVQLSVSHAKIEKKHVNWESNVKRPISGKMLWFRNESVLR